MKRLNKIGLIITVTFLLILTIPSPVGAVDRDFEEDDILVFGAQQMTKRTVETTDSKTDGLYYLYQKNTNLEITNIDSDDTIDYTTWNDIGNEVDIKDVSFDSDLAESITLFSPSYTVEDNDIILRGINSPPQILFIDPNWDNINDDLAKNIEDWEDSLWVDGDEEIRDIDDFVDSCTSFSLMGESDLSNGLNKFTETTHKWFGEMKLEDEMHYYDHDDDQYRKYDTYEITWEIEFTEGGTLSNFKVTVKGEDVGKFSVETEMLIKNKAFSLGAPGAGLLPGVTHAFELPIIILAVVSSTVALRFIGKRKS